MAQVEWQRAVIKVGSALISPNGDGCSAEYLLAIASFITESRKQGKEVILVSSGSVAAGKSDIGFHGSPSIAEKQAMAAVGQARMLANWSRFFDFPCGQILLTYDDLRNRTRYVNAKNTLRELLKNQVLPIVNENDTVAINELKVGDNDNLAAYTALVAEADTVIICSDIDGLYTADPRHDKAATLITEVDQITADTYALAGGAGTSMGTGGMLTKIQAADKCAKSGIQTLIINGKSADSFTQLLAGQVSGTLFHPQASRDSAKRQWLMHTLKSEGVISIDEGAANALRQKGASLLPSGIVAVDGHFVAGDAVDIEFQGNTLGKGISLYGLSDLRQIKGINSQRIDAILGYCYGEEAIHRDDLILTEKRN